MSKADCKTRWAKNWLAAREVDKLIEGASYSNFAAWASDNGLELVPLILSDSQYLLADLKKKLKPARLAAEIACKLNGIELLPYKDGRDNNILKQLGWDIERKAHCPSCRGEKVTTTEEQLWLVNGMQSYCMSVKFGDANAKAGCLECGWQGTYSQLNFANEARK